SFLLFGFLRWVVRLWLTSPWCIYPLLEYSEFRRRWHRLPCVVIFVDVGSFTIGVQFDRLNLFALDKGLYHFIFIQSPHLSRNAVYFFRPIFVRPLNDDRHHQATLVAK